MNDFLLNAARIAPLAVPAVLGFFAAQRRLVGDVGQAIRALNALALYFAFPALIARSLASGDFALPSGWGFYVVLPASQIGVALAARIMGRGSSTGSLALTGLFGNIAYLGLPYALALYGDTVAGVTALIVAAHVAVGVSIGPLLLVRWSGGDGKVSMRNVLLQPLLWAPVAGFAIRALPAAGSNAIVALITPLAAAAAPVALFMLGLYLFQERAHLGRPSVPVAKHALLRLAVAPLLTAGLCLFAIQMDALERDHAALLTLLAGMPAAITTFSFAHAFDIGQRETAGAIVQSTLLAILTLPLLAWLVSMF